MSNVETGIEGLLIIEPKLFRDARGFFLESFQCERYSSLGLNLPFVQDNFSRSKYGVLRGLHFQKTRPQGKLVTCLNGQILDVVVDLRKDSVTYSQSFSCILDSEKKTQLWIPPGFAHGFIVLSETADFFYKCTDYYAPDDESGILWNDPDLNIDWLIDHPIISDKDLSLPSLREILA
jgi:dTDP-4-dehydrorhamnose 3,5-epimerase